MRERIEEYVRTWRKRGYQDGIPDEVPGELLRLGLAPSYKAICLAILRNDYALTSLGFAPRRSSWYTALKREELSLRKQLLTSPPA